MTSMAATSPGVIFICSSQAPRDRAFARRLAKDLRKLRMTPIFNRGRPGTLQPAADVDRAQTMLVVVSPQLAGSAPARVEYTYALQRGKSVVPLQVSPQAAIPEALKEIQWVDFSALYDQGLADLAGYLGAPNARLARRATLARVRGRAINIFRGLLATLMFIVRMVVVFIVLGVGGLASFGFVALLPAAFLEVGEEDYRRGDPITRRIVICKTLLGGAGGALIGLLPAAIGASSSSSSGSAGSTELGSALPTAVLLGAIGAALGWLFAVLERRSQDRGGVAFGKVMRIWHFCAQVGLVMCAIGLGLLSSASSFSSSGGSTLLAIFATFAGLGVLLAAPLEWLRSPVRHSKRGRTQVAAVPAPRVGSAAAAEASANLVFISHASADNELTVRLAKDLGARDIPIWVDRHRLAPGMHWPDEIRQSVDNSSTLLLLLSRSAAVSDWVRQEYQRAIEKGKPVVVARLDPDCAIPAELDRAPAVEFSALYMKGLLDVLVALKAAPGAIAAATRIVKQRIRYAWLISTVRAGALGYMLYARITVFGVASFTLLGCFDRIAGVHSLAEYLPIWLLRAAPGAALGAFVETGEDSSIAGAKLTWRIRLAKIVNATLLGAGLFGPVPALIFMFFANNSLADLPSDSSTLYVILAVIGSSLVGGLMALPIVRIERRNHEDGKAAFVLLMRAARYISRGFIGGVALVIPLYLLIDSPFNLFGPPHNNVLGGMGFWWGVGVIAGAVMAALQLFFFPSSLTRKALRRLSGDPQSEAVQRIPSPVGAAQGRRVDGLNRT